ncbi:hypothetical protein M8J75_011427 [Diaphorina citri]|nr:hypothetical protein M8J75_011427 [Diaphorina citri]
MDDLVYFGPSTCSTYQRSTKKLLCLIQIICTVEQRRRETSLERAGGDRRVNSKVGRGAGSRQQARGYLTGLLAELTCWRWLVQVVAEPRENPAPD